MLRRTVTVSAFAASGARFALGVQKPVDPSQYRGPVPGGHGLDNEPGVYATRREATYFEKAGMANPSPTKIYGEHEPRDRSDNIPYPEYDLIQGKYENVPGNLVGAPGALLYHNFTRSELKETVDYWDVVPKPPQIGHHPEYEYLSNTGKREGNISNSAGTIANWNIRSAIFSLYRCCLRGLPIVKHGFWINMPLDKMKDRIRERFISNRNVRDPDAIKHLLHNGWMEYQDTISFRRTKTTADKWFGDHDDRAVLRSAYADEEGQLLEERRLYNGERSLSDGPYGGFWSESGRAAADDFAKLAGRIPKSWTDTKGYFDMKVPDGTNYWERNLDYEGWYEVPLDPDSSKTRKELASYVESAYNQPKHYASKNRRSHRRAVKDVEMILESTVEENWSRHRDIYFQYHIRGPHPESNRVHAEKMLAIADDEMYSTRWDEQQQFIKQAMREMPNPALWKTDAFYHRLRYLSAPLEYNWGRVPVGASQEKLFNDWISDDVNVAIYNSKAFAAIKASKAQNPMALTWGDFYDRFDPDVPETRRLPWYHAEFDYDRRDKWDEKCMRQKKWIQTGDVDVKNSFFDSFIVKYEQQINRSDILKKQSVEVRYAAPRMVQLYRALNRTMDVALANQMRAFLGDKASASAIESADFSAFVFQPPTLIFPDGEAPVKLGLDGSPITASA